MRIPNVVRRCVAFACYLDSKGELRTAGTVFFVGLNIPGPLGRRVGYTITAKHVIDGVKNSSSNGIVYIRLNPINENQTPELIDVSIDQWLYHPTDQYADVAILDWVPDFNQFDVKSLKVEISATADVVNRCDIGPGDEIFLAGLFVNHIGAERNVPLVRMGNIAAMPGEPIDTSYGPMVAYLIESRSIGGLSGAPVMVHLSGYRRRGDTDVGDKSPVSNWISEIYWLGLMHGHWDRPPKIGQISSSLDSFDGSGKINMGIAIVVPVEKILETINHPELLRTRMKIQEQAISRNLPTADNATDSGDDGITREDFLSALRKASHPTSDGSLARSDEGNSETSE